MKLKQNNQCWRLDCWQQLQVEMDNYSIVYRRVRINMTAFQQLLLQVFKATCSLSGSGYQECQYLLTRESSLQISSVEFIELLCYTLFADAYRGHLHSTDILTAQSHSHFMRIFFSMIKSYTCTITWGRSTKETEKVHKSSYEFWACPQGKIQ